MRLTPDDVTLLRKLAWWRREEAKEARTAVKLQLGGSIVANAVNLETEAQQLASLADRVQEVIDEFTASR